VTAESLEAKGIEAARMAQNPSHFNEPIRDFTVLMEEGRLRFEDSKMLRWCFNNACVTADRQDRLMFNKKESKDKIDPVVAAVMAYRIASRQPSRVQGSYYVV
jgi:phage terminase large subunit-like protein